MAYIGSANFSDQCRQSIDFGCIITEREQLEQLAAAIENIAEESEPYYENQEDYIQLAVETHECLSLISNGYELLQTSYQDIMTEVGITFNEEVIETIKSIFRRALDQGINIRKFMEHKLEIDNTNELDLQLEQIESEENKFLNLYKDPVYELIHYDPNTYAAETLGDNTEAFDEKLEFYAEESVEEANDKLESLYEASKPYIAEMLECLKNTYRYLKQCLTITRKQIKTNPSIDNTEL